MMLSGSVESRSARASCTISRLAVAQGQPGGLGARVVGVKLLGARDVVFGGFPVLKLHRALDQVQRRAGLVRRHFGKASAQSEGLAAVALGFESVGIGDKGFAVRGNQLQGVAEFDVGAGVVALFQQFHTAFEMRLCLFFRAVTSGKTENEDQSTC